MKSPYEIEQKFRLSQPRKILRLIQKLRARPIRSGTEYNEFYDRMGALRKKESALRLRRAGRRAWLTFKGPRVKHRYKKRAEIELSVDDVTARRLLEALGFKRVARYQKSRSEFAVAHSRVVVDHVPRRGWFLEIEGTAQAIDRLSKYFGLSRKDREERTYLELLGLR
jgi:adenylate cyclase class 2